MKYNTIREATEWMFGDSCDEWWITDMTEDGNFIVELAERKTVCRLWQIADSEFTRLTRELFSV